MDRGPVILVLLVLVLVFLWKRSASHGQVSDQHTSTGTPPAAPDFGTDHAQRPDPLVLKADDIAHADAVVEATNPAVIADRTDPTVHASNAYYGQFIGKIT